MPLSPPRTGPPQTIWGHGTDCRIKSGNGTVRKAIDNRQSGQDVATEIVRSVPPAKQPLFGVDGGHFHDLGLQKIHDFLLVTEA